MPEEIIQEEVKLPRKYVYYQLSRTEPFKMEEIECTKEEYLKRITPSIQTINAVRAKVKA